MGVMRVLNSKGDTETRWNPQNPISTNKAEVAFHEAIDSGLLAWKADEHGVGSERLLDFDPSAHEILLTKKLVGG